MVAFQPVFVKKEQRGTVKEQEQQQQQEQDQDIYEVLPLAGTEQTEEAKDNDDERVAPPKESGPCGLSKAVVGIVICVVSGVLSPMLNLGFTFGDSIRAGAEELGASKLVSSSTVWVLAIGAGFVFNGGYPLFLLCRHRSWHEFRAAGARNTGVNMLLMLAMAVLWFGGTVVYGMGATLIGSLGATIGWPVYMALMVLSANVGALLQGEWSNTTARPRWLLVAGLAILLLSIVFFALSSVFDSSSSTSASTSSSSWSSSLSWSL